MESGARMNLSGFGNVIGSFLPEVTQEGVDRPDVDMASARSEPFLPHSDDPTLESCFAQLDPGETCEGCSTLSGETSF